jgi:hypothetical protein
MRDDCVTAARESLQKAAALPTNVAKAMRDSAGSQDSEFQREVGAELVDRLHEDQKIGGRQERNHAFARKPLAHPSSDNDDPCERQRISLRE